MHISIYIYIFHLINRQNVYYTKHRISTNILLLFIYIYIIYICIQIDYTRIHANMNTKKYIFSNF